MSRLSTFFWDNDILAPQRSRTLACLGGWACPLQLAPKNIESHITAPVAQFEG
jgi:hypothetical protein